MTTTNIKTLRETYTADKTDRTNANRFYQQVAVDSILEPNRASIPGVDRLERARGCLEQLGRMMEKGMGAGDVLQQAQIAADALANGRTVKQVEIYLRHGRISGYFDAAAFLSEDYHQLTAPSKKKNTPECDDCFVDRYMREVPRDALTRLEAIMLIDILNNVDDALHRRKLDLYMWGTKADMVQSAEALRAKLIKIYFDGDEKKATDARRKSKPAKPTNRPQGPTLVEVETVPTREPQGPTLIEVRTVGSDAD